MPNRIKQWFTQLKETNKFHPSWILLIVVATASLAALIWVPAELVARKAEYHRLPTAAGPPADEAEPADKKPDTIEQPGFMFPGRPRIIRVEFSPPDPDTLPADAAGTAIRLGRNLFNDPRSYARDYVGNRLSCANCHLDEGRKRDAAPLWAAYAAYPADRARTARFEERLQACFVDGLAGKAPPAGSRELAALSAYGAWLATGAPAGAALAGRGYPALPQPARAPDAARGAAVYTAQCALCHGADGAGTKVGARYVFPPLWGDDAFRAGAGMAEVATAARFIRANMPLGQGGTLAAQDAWDVAAYMNSQPRPRARS